MASTSRTLFCQTDGQSMKFFMRPSETKARLRPLIEERGGFVSSKLDTSPGWIKLAAIGEKIKSDDYYKAEYVQDCIDANQLLPLQQYRYEQEKTKHSSGEHSSTMNNVTISGRSRYDSDEDAAIISYVAKHPELSYSGNRMWKKMELLKITEHSWQSMKNRFLHKLVDDLPRYVKAQEEGTTKSDARKTSKSKDSSSESNKSNTDSNRGDSESSESRGSDEPSHVANSSEKSGDDSSSDFDSHLLEMAEERSSKMEADSSTNQISNGGSSSVAHQNGNLHNDEERPRGTNRMQLRSQRQPSGDTREPTRSDRQSSGNHTREPSRPDHQPSGDTREPTRSHKELDAADERRRPSPKRRRVIYDSDSDSDDQDSLTFSLTVVNDEEKVMKNGVNAVVAFVKNAMEVYNLSAKTVVQMLSMHSGHFQVTTHHLEARRLPEGFVPWSTRDDEKLKNSTDSSVIKALYEKYGQKAVKDRLEFFSSR